MLQLSLCEDEVCMRSVIGLCSIEFRISVIATMSMSIEEICQAMLDLRRSSEERIFVVGRPHGDIASSRLIGYCCWRRVSQAPQRHNDASRSRSERVGNLSGRKVLPGEGGVTSARSDALNEARKRGGLKR